ncbi:ATPase, T2SS/T4P/T4SS family [Natrinema sp. J7-2]|uniref:ATPase, T2SS/T4P/T4SS family n=1 Tax=Natrinema sp. (strain J7-2) TaxID=406552 RepID=UPI0006779CB6|nr:ATPase, T2SS/T4P/T4SS family [Natrinema sp. J7-2]
MAIDEADQSDAGDFSEGEASDPASEGERSHEADLTSNSAVRVGTYTWEEFMNEYGYGDEVADLYPDDGTETDQLGLDTGDDVGSSPSGDDWDRVTFDPESYLGYHPDDLEEQVLPTAGDSAATLRSIVDEYLDPETTPVVKDIWTWEHYKREYGHDDASPLDKSDALGFDPETLEGHLAAANDVALELDDVVEERTVNVQEDLDEDEFFSTAGGNTTVSNRYDLEKAVPFEKKSHFREVERYWVNKPYAYVVIFHSEKENEKKYYMIEPYQNEIEAELKEFLSGKLRKAIKYSEDGIKEKATEGGRRTVIEDETRRLLKRYDLFEATSGSTSEGVVETIRGLLDDDEATVVEAEDTGPSQLGGIEARPEPAILADDPDTLSEYQVEKLLYLLTRDFIGYERIDGIKHDINVEDISVDGYNSPVFVYHSEYEQIISNIYHGEDELDDFVVKLAQRSGKGISKRLPQVDATLPDGSRAQLTLGKEVSDHGTNYTIRQFKDVPFTPIDLINWNTFSLDEMAFLWLAIENHKSLIFAGGTASGKTTSLNAVSLFIPSSAKIVSIEDTREVELPQRNWIASVTRPSFSDDEQGDVDEFDLLEAALRQRPDYIVMGEIRGEEGRTLFQVMSTGHTTYTTFHADSVDEVLKRFTTDPINVSKTMFTALDLVSIQTQTRVQGRKVRRNKSLTEINHYEAEHDEINVQDVYQWQAETDEFLKMGDSNTLETIQFDRGWSREKLEDELFKREVILAYLIKNGLNTYAQVAATVQAFINDPETILTLIANGQLEDSLEDLREMESVLIDVDPEKEELVPRPDATSETYNLSTDILERAEESLFEEFRGEVPSGLASSLGDVEAESTIEVDRADSDEFEFGGEIDETVDEDEWELGDSSTAFAIDGDDGVGDEPAWLSDEAGAGVAADADAETAPGEADESASAGEPPAASSTPAETTAQAASSNAADEAPGSSDGTGSAASDSTVLPSDDADDSDLGGLFDDMGETIDGLDDSQSGQTAGGPESTASDPTEAAGIDSMFPDGDLDSIFDPDSEDRTSTAASGDQSEAETDTASDDDPEPPTIDLGTGSTDSDAASSDSPAADTASDNEPEPPTIDLGTEATDSETAGSDTPAADPAADDESEPPTIALDDGATDSDGTESNSPAADATEPDGSPAGRRDDGTGDTDTGSDAQSATSEAESTDPPTIDIDDGGVDPSAEDAADDEPIAGREPTAGEPKPDSGDEAGDDSIFDDDSESVFTDDETETVDDDGSLFDANGSDDESIFKGDDDGDAADGNDGIFDADGSDEETDS